MIIAIGGKIASGKNTVCDIIQDLCKKHNGPNFEQKAFAGKLKLIGSILSGVPVEMFEDQEFKKQVMSKEWIQPKHYNCENYDIENGGGNCSFCSCKEKEMTYREFLQRLGTEAMRDGLHINVWVNSLFADYKPTQMVSSFPPPATEEEYIAQQGYPNWIITDMRFPNEMEAVEERKGITIRVVRYPKTVEQSRGPENIETVPFDPTNNKHMDLWKGDLSRLHASETALDNAKFDYEIINDGTLEDLVEKVKEILIKENII
jgi:hypothetical protein